MFPVPHSAYHTGRTHVGTQHALVPALSYMIVTPHVELCKEKKSDRESSVAQHEQNLLNFRVGHVSARLCEINNRWHLPPLGFGSPSKGAFSRAE